LDVWTNGDDQVGNEFSSVEALWSQFENVMAKDPEAEAREKAEGAEDESMVENQEGK
jgi:DASH complex subunit DAD1